MWRPLEIFLYDWWPIRAEGRLFDRLAAIRPLAYRGTRPRTRGVGTGRPLKKEGRPW